MVIPPRFSQKEISERRAVIGGIFVDHPQLKCVHKDLANQLRYGTEGSAAKLTMLLADSGCGKTTAILDFVGKAKKGGRSDVLYISLPVPCTIKGMTCEMLRRLGDPLWDRTSTVSRNSFRIIHQLREQKLRLLIIDEFQHLIDHDRDRVVHLTTDWLKTILDEAGVPVVCVGLPKSIEVIRANAQLERRTSKVTTMHPFAWEGADQALSFRAFLELFEQALPFAVPSNLSNPVLARAIHQASSGFVGRVSQLIWEATMVSMLRTEGPDCLTSADFAEAYLGLPFGKQNPFDMRMTAISTLSNDRRAVSMRGHK